MRRILWIAGPVALLAAVYFLAGPYLFPTSVALGPCLKDWTSPASYTARASPMESLDFQVGQVEARLCYGSPRSRGRRIFGETGVVADGRIWRMGANEPTRLFTDGPLELGNEQTGEIQLPAGRYSLYALPGPDEWEIFVTRSTWHWGNQISADVRAREVGSLRVPRVRLGGHVEELTFTAEDGHLILAWGFTRIRIPIAPSE